MAKKATPISHQKKPNATHKKPSSPKPGNTKLWLLALLGLIIFTYILYTPALKNSLTSWDDKDYIERNNLVHELNSKSIQNMFSLKTGLVMGNYHPVSMLSYAIEYHYARLNPAVYHKVNVFLHLINILLVFLFIRLLTRNNYLVAFITAALFAIHPLHVESVAWISERKDLLYTLFEMGALCAYLLYIRNASNKWLYYLLAIVLFLFSILSKGMAIAMVALLPLIDYFEGRKLKDMKIWVEKIPFLALAIFFGVVALQAQQDSKALGLADYSFYDRLLFAGYGLITYLWKSIVPAGLSTFYDYPLKGTYGWYIVYVVLALGIATLVYLSARKTKVIVFGALFFLFSLAMVLQLIPVGGAIISDRYTYIPYIGLFFMMGYGAWYVFHHKTRLTQKLSPILKIALPLFAIMLSVVTYNRIFVWKDTISIWNDALAKYPNCVKGLSGRGDAYNENKQYLLAIKDLDKAIKLKYDYSDALYNRAISYFYLGTQALNTGQKEVGVKYLEQSISDNTEAIKHQPNMRIAYFNRSGSYYTLGKFDQALADALQAEKLGHKVDPEYFKALRQVMGGK